MNPSLVLKAIPAINKGNLSIDEFVIASGLGRNIAMDLVKFLVKNEIGHFDSNKIEFDLSDKMRAAMLAIQEGADVEDISQLLNWKDFELLAAGVLDASGYVTQHGFRLKKPRIEIDVVGIKDDMALLIDCKHWKRSSPSVLERFAMMQVERTKAFLSANNTVRYAVPIILTLHSESTVFANNVPVVPITKFRSFLNEMGGYLDDIKVIRV